MNAISNAEFKFFKTSKVDGVYISELDASHNFLASDAQRRTMYWAKHTDHEQGYHVFGTYMQPITFPDNYEMSRLNAEKAEIPEFD